MSNSSNGSSSSFARRALLNVPSPNPERVAYARFIPREELGDVSCWSPRGFGLGAGAGAAEPVAAEPAGPTTEQLRAETTAARQAGYEQGYREGLAALEGFKRAHAEQVTTELGAFVRGLDAEFEALHAGVAEAVARVAVQLARQVLRSELRAVPEQVSVVAAEAVEAVLRSARHITLRVHPQDLPLVAEGAQAVLRERGARLVADANVQRGGCSVDSDVGEVDAQIGTRWALAAAALGSDEPWDAAPDSDDAAGPSA